MNPLVFKRLQTRQKPQQITVILISLFIYLGSLTTSSIASTQGQPNIVYINVDDLGWSDLGYNNHSGVFNTPNINRLAERSLQFTDAYAGAANCAPSRAVLMSGQYTPRHGIYTVSPSARGNNKTRKIIPTKNLNTLADDNITLAEMLKSAGYINGHFGKWHLGDDPKTQGFDYNVAGHHKGHPKTYFSPYNLPFLSNGPEGEYLTDRLTTEAISWIKSLKHSTDKPFFLYFPFYTVHTPLEAIKAVKQKYLNHPKIRNERHATYAAMVEILDNNVGRLLNALKTHHLIDNTLIIFTSDNGGIRQIAHQDPLRAGKGSYYEGGVRVPLLISWPGKIKPGISNQAVINADFYPTFKTISQAKLANKSLDGVDLSALLFKQKPLKERALFWHFPIYLQAYDARADQSRDPLFRTRPGSSMRKGKWKLHHYFEDNQYELYDLEHDLGEHVNLAKYLPKTVEKLAAELKQWRTSIKAPIPVQKNPEYDPQIELAITEKKLYQGKK